MQLNEISNKVNTLTRSWEEFKSVNDRREKERNKKGFNDPLLDNQLKRISDSIDQQKSKINEIEVAMKRPFANSSYKNNEDDVSYKNAFTDYLRKGHDEKLSDIESSYSSSGDSDGGYLVRPQLASQMTKNITNQVALRELASVQTISSDALDIIEDVHQIGAGWVSEHAPRSDTRIASLGKKKIAVHEMYSQPRATQKLIDDAAINVEEWLIDKITDSFSNLENEAFIHGDGVSKPRGILSYPDGKNFGNIECLKSKELSADDIVKLYFSLDESYASKGTFLLNRYTLSQIRTLKCPKTSQYLWTPGLQLGESDKILGANVKTCNAMPVFEKSNVAVAFSDFKTSYKIIDRVGIRVLRDPFTQKPFVKFYAIKRVGGDVVNSNAIKLLKHQA